MRATLDSLLSQIREFFSGLSARERRRFLVLGAMIVVLSVAAAWLLARETYAIVWTGLDSATAGTRTAAMVELGYNKYRLEDGGSTILVPTNQVAEVRNALAAAGVTDLSGYNDDIYSQASALGMTAEDRRVYLQWQINDNLRRDFRGLSMIEDAKVQVSLGSTTNYALGKASPSTAAIMVTVVGDAPLSQTEVSAIINYATGAVEGLTADNVSLMDRVGRVYSIVGTGLVPFEDEVSAELSVVQQRALEAQLKAESERQLHNLFVPFTGAGNLSVTVNLRLSFDKEFIEKVEYAPPVAGQLDGIAVSLYEALVVGSDEEYVGGVPGTDSNGMSIVEYPYLELGEDEYVRQYVRQVNYEINQTITTIEKAQGSIADLSVTVIVNSDVVSSEYKDAMTDAAAKALGVDPKRVSIQFMPRQEMPAPEQPGVFENPRLWELLLFAVKAIVVLLLGLAVIAFLRAIFAPGHKVEPQLVLADGPVGIDYVAAGDEDELAALLLTEEGELGEDGARGEPVPSLAEIEKAQKPESIIQLENFIDRDPAAVAQLLRNWLNDD